MRKDEKYVKGLISKVFHSVGNFQRFEFVTGNMSSRPDFVILDDNSFKFFEIKSELDSLTRLENQIKKANGYCTEFYIVINRSKYKKALKKIPWNYHPGFYFIEDLEKGISKPAHEVEEPEQIQVEKVAHMLWVNDLRRYVREKLPNAFAYSYDGKRTLANMYKTELTNYFNMIYPTKEMLPILNEVLAKRHRGRLFI